MITICDYKVCESKEDFNQSMRKDIHDRGYISVSGQFIIREMPKHFPCVFKRAEVWDTHTIDTYFPVASNAELFAKVENKIAEYENIVLRMKNILKKFS